MKKCPSCEKKNLQNAKFCMDCGTSLAEPDPTFSETPMAKAFVELISPDYLTAWADEGDILTIVSKANPEAIAVASRGTRNPSSIAITAPVGVFHKDLPQQWKLEDELFTPAELGVLHEIYADYYSESPDKAQNFSAIFHEEHFHYIVIANDLFMNGSGVDMFDGAHPEAIPHAVATIRTIDEAKNKNSNIFLGLEGIASWNLSRCLAPSGQQAVFAAVPGTSNKSKRFPVLGYIPLAEGWQAIRIQYEYNFNPKEESTQCVLQSIFDIRDVWMESFARLTKSCDGYIAPFSALTKAIPLNS